MLAALMEALGEVVQRHFALGQGAQACVHAHPQQRALVVEIKSALPVGPGLRLVVEIENALMNGVVQVTPVTARLRGVVGLQLRQHRHGVVRFPQAGTRGQHHGPVLGLAFVHPQLVVVHRRVVMRHPGRARAPCLAYPCVRVFVRQQVVVTEGPLAAQVAVVHAVLAGLRVLQTDAAEHIGHRQQEVVARVRPRAEDRIRLAHQCTVCIQHLGIGLQGLRIFGHHVQPYRLFRGVVEGKALEVAAREHGRINQGHQWHGCIVLGATLTARHVQRAAALPAVGQTQ
ncbi:hypothetical protein D3C71_1463250 [compost metagenome]